MRSFLTIVFFGILTFVIFCIVVQEVTAVKACREKGGIWLNQEAICIKAAPIKVE